MNIRVLCAGSSARSILLESLLNHGSGGRVQAWSAGSRPAGRVNPQSLKLLAAKGFPTDHLTSQSWDDYALETVPKVDVVITVCGSAAGEECPYLPGAPLRAHWGVEDPAGAEDAPAAFAVAYTQLKSKADAFLAQDIENMDQSALMDALQVASAP